MKKKFIILLIIVFLLPLLFPSFFANQLEAPLRLFQEPSNADVIIIHGGGTTKDNHLPLLAQQRVNQGLFLWRNGLAPQIIVTGGPTKYHNVEAEVMASELVQRGMPTAAILKEGQSYNTHENVTNSLAVMKQNNFSSAIVVTSPYHSFRTNLIWKKTWPNGHYMIAPASKTIVQSGVNPYQALWSVVREYLATAWYWTRGWL